MTPHVTAPDHTIKREIKKAIKQYAPGFRTEFRDFVRQAAQGVDEIPDGSPGGNQCADPRCDLVVFSLDAVISGGRIIVLILVLLLIKRDTSILIDSSLHHLGEDAGFITPALLFSFQKLFDLKRQKELVDAINQVKENALVM